MNEIEIPIEELRERKIFVATPMYGGMCGGQYTKSTADLSKLAMHYGMEIEFFYLFNESLITRARNYCVDEFLRHDNFTHLMFIDSDIGFNANVRGDGKVAGCGCAVYVYFISWTFKTYTYTTICSNAHFVVSIITTTCLKT